MGEKVVVKNTVYAEFDNGVYETKDAKIIEFLDNFEERGRRYFKDESFEERKMGQELTTTMAEEFAESKLNDMGIRTDISTSSDRMLSKEVMLKNPVECPMCGFKAKSKFGLFSHMKKHRNAPTKLT